MELDWNLCVICQTKTSEALKCPLENAVKKGNKKDAYTNFLNHVNQFQDIDSLPEIVKFGCVETAENWEFQRASWQKSCYAKFSSCKLERAKLKRKRSSDSTKTSSRGKRQRLNSEVCFLCEKGEDDGDLLQVSTFDTDANLRTVITELNDFRLLVRIVGGELIAIGAKYHLKCLIELKNRYRSHVRKSNKDKQNIDENVCNSRVFVELASYVKKDVNSGKLLFKLSELHSLYESRLEGLGNAKSVNKTRLKERSLEYFKEAQEQFDCRNTFLFFKEGMRNIFQDPLRKRDFSEDALILTRAASIIRKDIFNHEGILFNGSFPEKCQDTS